MLNIESIKPHMPVVCSQGGQFAVVDHMEGATSIKLAKDKNGQHHFMPVSWVTRVDEKVHIDRPGNEAMKQWTTEPDGMRQAHKDPSWWNETHSSAWEQSKSALRSDWEQSTPRSAGAWVDDEPALRYGHGARHYYAKQPWSDELEGKLSKDWDSTGNGSTWDRVKSAVRRGWESVKHAVD